MINSLSSDFYFKFSDNNIITKWRQQLKPAISLKFITFQIKINPGFKKIIKPLLPIIPYKQSLKRKMKIIQLQLFKFFR